MSKSARLTARELHRLRNLAGECMELGGDRVLWKEHMLAGLNRNLSASASLVLEYAAAEGRLVDHVAVGLDQTWTPARFRVFENPALCPLVAPTMQFTEPDGVASRRQLVADGSWYRSGICDEYLRPSGLDDTIGFLHVTADRVQCIALYRPRRDQAFAARPLGLLHWFGRLVAPHWGGRLTGSDGHSLRDLPPRLQQVLQCLLEGDSEQQTALRLGLSRHTIHVHVQRLYRYFGSRSRGELFARTRRLPVEVGSPNPGTADGTLPPWLRPVLECLRQGDSEKQAALRLGLNPHTVHYHVKQLYRHFRAATRGELLARTADRHSASER